MRKSNNPFKDLKITLTEKEALYGDGSIKQKAFFEYGSYESNAISIGKRIDILARFIFEGYDLHKVVHEYLKNKVALKDTARIFHIASTFKCYTEKIASDSNVNIEESVVENENKLPKEELWNAIDEFENIVKNVFKKESYIDLSNKVEKNKAYTIRDLLKAYIGNDRTKYTDISNYLKIDLEEDIILKLRERDESECTQPLWKYVELYTWYQNDLLRILKNNILNEIDLEPCLQLPAVAIYEALKKKYYPKEYHDKIMSDEDFRRECILDFAEKVISVLWQRKKIFEDEYVYFVRCNYTGLPAKYINDLFKKNTISICIEDHENIDQDYYSKLINDEEVKQNKKLLYIERFTKLAKLVRSNDVLVVASYSGKNTKIGLLKKGTAVVPDRKENDKLTLYCLNLKSVYCNPVSINQKKHDIDLREYPLLKALVPANVTVSPLQKRAKAICRIYYGIKYPLELSLLSDEALEIMCTEFLRSHFQDESLRICYQITKTGGNLADVDILGVNKDNERIAAQVTSTKNIKLVDEKIKRIKDFPAEKKIIFSNGSTSLFMNDCRWIDIASVFESFKNDEFYRTLLERLIEV